MKVWNYRMLLSVRFGKSLYCCWRLIMEFWGTLFGEIWADLEWCLLGVLLVGWFLGVES